MSERVLLQFEAIIAALLSQSRMALLARIALTSAFWLSGISKTLDFQGAVGEVRGLSGIEPAALIAILVIAVQFGGSLLVIWGARWAWIGVGLLAGFTVFATLLAHAWWTKGGTRSHPRLQYVLGARLTCWRFRSRSRAFDQG